MTRREAELVCEILTNADGGCTCCANELLLRFEKAFPEFEDIAVEARGFQYSYDKELERRYGPNWRSGS